MPTGKPNTLPVAVASARTVEARNTHTQPTGGLLYQVLSALAWNG